MKFNVIYSIFNSIYSPNFYSTYNVSKKYCKGGFSTIYICNKISDNSSTDLILKKQFTPSNKVFIKNEIIALNKLNDLVSTPQLLFNDTTPLWGYIVMENINAITFSQYLNDFISKENPISSSIIYDIINIFSDIHKKGIIHRDIKPDNILINPDTYKITVIDFGLSIYSNNIYNCNMNEFTGSYQFACPEMFKGIFYNASCDTWSIGVLCFLLITKHLPYKLTSYEVSQLRQFKLISDSMKSINFNLIHDNDVRNKISSFLSINDREII